MTRDTGERREEAGKASREASAEPAASEAAGAKEPKEAKAGNDRPERSDRADGPLRYLSRSLALVMILAMIALVLAGAWTVVWQRAQRSPAPPLLDGVPFSTEIRSAEGTLLRLTPASDGIRRVRTPLAQIDSRLVDATLFYEDRLFRRHRGVNPGSLVRAGIETLLGERRMGASTITMQLARMRLHLETDTPRGKIRQIWHALRYEAHYSKDEILEAYLNLAPYGGNVEGAGAAALVWFGKTSEKLSAAEATALAVIPQNPVKRRPSRGGSGALDDARIRLGLAMIRAGYLPERLRDAVRAPLKIQDASDLPFLAPHFTQMALSRMKRAPEGHAGGRVDVTLRSSLQASMEGLVRDTVARLRPWGVRNAALAVADARSRSLLALVGSADWHDDAIAGEVNAWNARRSPGSTLKPFVYGLALEQGLIHEKTVLIDRPRSFGGWAPENADGAFEGPVTAEDALVRSRNLPAAELERRLDPGLWTLLKRAGVRLPHDRSWYGLSIVLGGAEVTMGELTRLYCALADDALVRPVRILAKDAAPASGELLSGEAAFIVRRMLASRGEFITADGARRELLYKTGTSNGWRDAWAAGFVGPYVIVAWLGDFSGAPNPQLQGARLAAPLLKEAALRLAADPATKWPREELAQDELARRRLNVARETVCAATGDLSSDALELCPRKTLSWIIPGRTSVRDSGVFRRILVRESTGLRACTPGEGVRPAVWEFWPTHFQKVFLDAGIVKRPPPPYELGCERAASLEGGATAAPGRAPMIHSPRSGSTLVASPATGAARTLLAAGTDPDARLVYWYDGAHFLGVSSPGRPMEWFAQPGDHRITATDDLGRSGTATVRVRR